MGVPEFIADGDCEMLNERRISLLAGLGPGFRAVIEEGDTPMLLCNVV